MLKRLREEKLHKNRINHLREKKIKNIYFF